MIDLENRIWLLQTPISFIHNPDHISCKEQREDSYEKKESGQRKSSTYGWYKYGEKSRTFFPNLKKNAGCTKLLENYKKWKWISNLEKLNNELFHVFSKLFKENQKSSIPFTKTAVMRLIEKKDKDKRYIQNRRSISLLNVVTVDWLIKSLPYLLPPNQTAHVKDAFISKGRGTICDIL